MLEDSDEMLIAFRMRLAKALVDGIEFDQAWKEAFSLVRGRWKTALVATKPAWQRAWHGESMPLDNLAESRIGD